MFRSTRRHTLGLPSMKTTCARILSVHLRGV
jgi:hypothetical protein